MNYLKTLEDKCFNLDELAVQVETWKKNGEQVVFTNGCFDILHLGHVTYLAKAAETGTKLIVALNSDFSVRKQGKGPERPINPEHARLLVLAALGFIDAVVLFDSETPIDLIERLLPNVLVKGADYDANSTDPNDKKYIVGSDLVRNSGGKVLTIPIVEGFSTTSIVRKLQS